MIKLNPKTGFEGITGLIQWQCLISVHAGDQFPNGYARKVRKSIRDDRPLYGALSTFPGIEAVSTLSCATVALFRRQFSSGAECESHRRQCHTHIPFF